MELTSYETARSLVYTVLTGSEKYRQLDGPYSLERFDFCAETHAEISDALRDVMRSKNTGAEEKEL